MNRMRDEFRRDQHKSAAELEREIDATRAELSAALEDLEQSLSPRELLDDMVERVTTRVRRDGGEFLGNLGNNVKQHPLPALLTSVGILWMMAAEGRGRSAADESAYGTGRRLRERWHDAQAAVRHGRESAQEGYAQAREAASSARETVSSTAASMRRRASRVSSTARRQAGAARAGVDHLLHEQPLVLGLLGLAAGAIAGAALPSTREEDEAFGFMRDRAVDRLKTAGAEGVREARERAGQAAEEIGRSVSTGNGGERHGTERGQTHRETTQEGEQHRHH